MDLREGFALDEPPVTVPWSLTPEDLRRLMGTRLRAVTHAGPVMQGWFPEYQWDMPGAYIRHYVLYRFGAEEHLRMIRKDAEATDCH